MLHNHKALITWQKRIEQHPQIFIPFNNRITLCQKSQMHFRTIAKFSIGLASSLHTKITAAPTKYILHTGSLMGNRSEWLTQLFRLMRFIVWIKPRKNGSGETDERCQEKCSLCLWPDPYLLMQYLFGGLILFVMARNYNSCFFSSFHLKSNFPSIFFMVVHWC